MPLDFQLSEEHQLLRNAVRQMLSRHEHQKKQWREMTHRDHKFNYELWQEFADIGLLGALVPEEYGGNNSGLVALTLGFEDICALGFSPSLMLVTAMDTACILRNGTDQQKRDIINSSDDKVHFNTRFARYRQDGSLIGEYDSIYIVNNQDNHWGVQCRSSFAP